MSAAVAQSKITCSRDEIAWSGLNISWAEVQCDMQRAIDMGFVCSVCLSIFCEVGIHQRLFMNLQSLAFTAVPEPPAQCLLACSGVQAWQLRDMWGRLLP